MSESGFTEIVLADGSVKAFERLCGLDLGIPLWHVRACDDRRLSEEALLLIELHPDDGPEERLRRIRRCATRSTTIVVADEAPTETALAYLFAGAFGVIDIMGWSDDTLRRALGGAVRGEPVFSREVLGRWIHETRAGVRVHEQAELTARQREIVTLVARGATDKEISIALGIGVATAQKHVAHTLRKLGAKNRAAAVGIIYRTQVDPAAM